MNMDELTSPQKRYLLAVYQLSLQYGAVRITELARTVHVSKSSATCMAAKLSEHGYLSKSYYGQISLTEKGRNIAVSVHQRTELLQRFLVQELSIEAECAAEDAAAIAVHTSETTAVRLAQFLGNMMESPSDAVLFSPRE